MRKTDGFMHRLGGRLLVLALLVLALLGAAPSAWAIDRIDEESDASLTIRYKVKGTTFTIYHVARMTGFGEFTPTKDFDDIVSADELNGLDSEGWSALAGTLSGYAGRDDQWHKKQEIGADGKVQFTGLDVGLYLVLGTPYGKNGEVQPSLVALPSRDEKDDWSYCWTIEPKTEKVEHYDEIKVQKVWSDGKSSSRPKEITVKLYVDGKLYDTAKLNAANKWRHVWDVSKVKQPAVFKVTECPVPSGYRHSIDYTGSYFTKCGGRGKLITIVNRKCTPVVPAKPSGKLPQTGLLWWPVPLLAGGGMALFLIGWLRRRRDEDE